MSRDETRPVPRALAAQSLSKCVEFADAAQTLLAAGKYNAAGLQAIHAGIAAADAALIAAAGIRSIAQDHSAAVVLLDANVASFGPTQRRQLTGLLKMKNQVAYDQRLLSEVEARQLVEHATRLSRWAKQVVEDHLGRSQ